ncbi:MAG: hypothetical protein ACF8NJ_10515 [Phycisphaerales bacterium JB038]
MTRQGGRSWLTRRVVYLALLSLLLGFVTTWLLAWASAVYVRPKSRHTVYPVSLHSPVQTLARQPVIQVNVSLRTGWGCEDLVISVDLIDEKPLPASWRLDCTRAPEWTVAHRCWKAGQPAPPGVLPFSSGNIPATATAPTMFHHTYVWTESRSGWPLPCTRWWVTNAGRPKRQFHGAFAPPDWLLGTSKKGLNAVLPYAPCWLGLVANVLFFAIVWFVGIHAVSFTRRRARAGYLAWCARRHRCERCGYDLRGCAESGCPECGHGRGASANGS